MGRTAHQGAVDHESPRAYAAKKMVRVGTGRYPQKETETSLIEQFLYPKFGPGQMWEEVAERVYGRRRRDSYRMLKSAGSSMTASA